MNNKNTKTNEKNKFRYFDRFVLPFPALFSQVRSEFLLEKNWKFTREDRPEFINPTFNDSKVAIRDRSAWLGDLRPFQLSEW